MLQLCFLQFTAVTTAPDRHTSTPNRFNLPTQIAKPVYWPGLIVAAALHLVWLGHSGAPQQKPAIKPPQAIMVNWLTSTSTVAPQQQPQPAPSTTKPEPVKVKTKPRKPAVAPTPLITRATEATTTPSAVDAPQPPTPAPSTPSSSDSTATAATNTSSANEASAAPTSLPHLNADYLDNPAPAYPAESRQAGEQGKVLLRVLVNANGNVDQITLRKSSGHARLDDAAMDTVKQWSFVPAQRASQAVSAWVVIPISFSLEG